LHEEELDELSQPHDFELLEEWQPHELEELEHFLQELELLEESQPQDFDELELEEWQPQPQLELFSDAVEGDSQEPSQSHFRHFCGQKFFLGFLGQQLPTNADS
jgi:hypothetical protein